MGVADLLAASANAPIADEPDDAVEEQTEKPEGETPEGEPSTEDLAAQKAEGEGEGDEEEAEETKSEEESDRLRQADYTRKTQALAEERKKLQAEIDAERESFKTKEEDFNEVFEWVKGLNDPEKAEYQLMRYFKPTMDALRDKWLLEAQEENNMTERERAALRRVRDLEIADRARKEDEEREAAANKKRMAAQRSAEFRKKLDGWLPEAAKTAGLDADEDMIQLVRNELANGKYWNMQWDLNVVTKAAQVVAKALKKAPPAPAKPTPPPSLKGPGAKAPAGKQAPKKTPSKRDSEAHFQKLREKYGY
jgi:hypothetical protein